MRIVILGENPTAAIVRSWLQREQFAVLSQQPEITIGGVYTITILEQTSDRIIFDSIDSPLETNIFQATRKLCKTPISIQTAGGVQSRSAIKIIFGPENSAAVAQGVVHGLLKTMNPHIHRHIAIQKEGAAVTTAKKKSLRQPFAFVLRLLRSAVVLIALSAIGYAQNPSANQNVDVKKIGGTAVPAGVVDTGNSAIKVNCVSGCSGGGGGGAATIADGADVNAGSTTDAAVTTDANGTQSSKLRGLVKMFSDVWDDGNNRFRINVENVSLPVTGTFWPATQPVSGTVAVTQSGTWTITSITNPVAVTGTFWQTTQPISVASLPLPSGASTEATLALIKAKTDNIDVALSTRTKPADQQHVIVDSSASLAVTGPLTDAQLRATPVPVSGTVTANAGSNLNTSALNLEATQALIKAKTDNLDVLLSTRTKPADQQHAIVDSGTITTVTTLTGIANALPAGSNVIGHVIADSGSTTVVTGSVAVTSAGLTDLDATTQTVSNGTAGTKSQLVGGVFNTTPPTLTNGQGSALQSNAKGELIVAQPTAADLNVTVTGTVTANAGSGTLAVSGPLTDAQLRASAVPVSGTFFQATQPVSGTVAATQSGTWTVQPGNTANTTAWKVDGSAVTQPVSGTFWQATQPVSGTFFQATQPVSAASLPLPSLASTSTKQSDGTQKTQIVDGSGNVVGSTSNALDINIKSGNPASITANAGTNLNTSALALDATLTGGTQKAITRGGAKGATAAADVTSTANGADHQGLDVSVQNASIAVTGTVTTAPPSNASTNVAQLAGTTTSVNSGTKDAGTLRVVIATDQPQLTNKLLVTPDSVALPANQSVNLNQVVGTAADVNSGTKSAGTLRVVLATDQPALTNKLLVTPDSVALPANQSVNAAQFGGTNVSTGTGAGGAGIPRVTISNDSSLAANQSVNAAQVAGVAPVMTAASTVAAAADRGLVVSISPNGGNPCANPSATLLGLAGVTSGTAAVQLVALSGSTKIYVCSVTITGVSGTSPTFSLKYGTGTACATGGVTLVGPFTSTANTVFRFESPAAVTPAGQALCYLDAGTLPVQNYNITYVQQ